MPAYTWVESSSGSALPTSGVIAGVDANGNHVYVARAYHEGNWIPAKVLSNKRLAYVAYDGKEYTKNSFQILCQAVLEWTPSQHGAIPIGAVEAGTEDKEKLYIARGILKSSVGVGKVHPSHKVAYISFNGKEYNYKTDYQILVLKS